MTRAEATQLAQQYARATLNTWQPTLTPLDCNSFLAAAHQLQQVPHLLFFLQLPLIDDALKQYTLQKVRIAYNLPEWLDTLVQLLITHKRSFLAPLVYEHIVILTYKDMKYMPCTVKTTIPLNHAQQELWKTFIKHITGYEPIITFVLDSSLIAGIRIESAEHLWEYSINAQLRSLTYTLV
jgi:F0F1-type ATP synthase delta subunit